MKIKIYQIDMDRDLHRVKFQGYEEMQKYQYPSHKLFNFYPAAFLRPQKMTGRSHPAFLPTFGIPRLGFPCFSEAPGYIHHSSMPPHPQIQRDFFVAFCEWISEETVGMVCTAAL